MSIDRLRISHVIGLLVLALIVAGTVFVVVTGGSLKDEPPVPNESTAPKNKTLVAAEDPPVLKRKKQLLEEAVVRFSNQYYSLSPDVNENEFAAGINGLVTQDFPTKKFPAITISFSQEAGSSSVNAKSTLLSGHFDEGSPNRWDVDVRVLLTSGNSNQTTENKEVIVVLAMLWRADAWYVEATTT
jgi:hypothetical protein